MPGCRWNICQWRGVAYTGDDGKVGERQWVAGGYYSCGEYVALLKTKWS